MPFEWPEAGAPVPASGADEKGTPDMSLKPYKVTVGGHETTLLLSDADAKAQGVYEEPKAKQAPAPKNKARSAKNKG